MQTLAELKRALTVGAKITMTDCPTMPSHKYLNVPRFIIKAQGNGVYLGLTIDDKRGSFLELPPASLIDIRDDGFTIYEQGERELTESEKKIIENRPSNRPENAEQCKIDALTDGSQMLWADYKYFRDLNAGYLKGYGSTAAERLNTNTGKIISNKIKGAKLYSYKIEK